MREGKANGCVGVGAVGSMTALGCNLPELVLGEIGKVGRVRVGHFDGWSAGLSGCEGKMWLEFESCLRREF